MTPLPDAARAVELHEAGYSERKIEAMTGINDTTVHSIIHGIGHWGKVAETPVFRQYRAQQKAALEAASRTIAAKCLVQVEKTLDKASAYQAAGIYGLMRQHERLDAGEATVHVAVAHKHEVEGLAELASALSKSLVSWEK